MTAQALTRGMTRPLARALARPVGADPYGGDGPLLIPGHLSPRVSLTRDADLWAPGPAGFRQVPAHQPWFDETGALVLQPPGDNMVRHSADPTRWTAGHLSIVPTGETDVLGLFTPARLVAVGQWGSWQHATAAITPYMTAGTTLGIDLWVRPGTSGRFSVQTTNFADVETGVYGPITGPYTIFGQDTATVTATEMFPGVWRVRLLFGSLVVGSPPWFHISVGHGSDTDGDYLEVLGAQVSSPAVFGSFIVTGGAAVSRPGDDAVYTPPAPEDIHLVGTAWDGTAHPEGAPLVLANPSAPVTLPAGRWSRAWATPAA